MTRASGLPRNNFTIALAGKIGNGAFELLRGRSPQASGQLLCLTDSAGAFYLNVSESLRYDSLAVAVILYGSEPFAGVAFPVSSATIFTEYEAVPYEDPASCVACKTTGTTTVVAGYVYNFPEQQFALPF
ncbi:MAG: hypothetical protein C4326_03840 [Ignavibacteria bacterium]